MGNAIFAAAVMLMTIPVTAAAAVVALANIPERNRTTPRHLSQWLPHLGVVTAGSLALAVQFLGLIFTLSRGPWLGTIFAVALMAGLVAVSMGRNSITKLASILGLAGIVTVAALLNPSFASGLGGSDSDGTSSGGSLSDFAISSPSVGDPTRPGSSFGGSTGAANADTGPGGMPSTISVAVEPTASGALQRLSSIVDAVSGGLTGGRQTHWKVSWLLIKERPWFEFDNLSLRWLRPLVGYGPDLFRYTYLLKSPPEGNNFFPLEPDHAHNYFIHQTVEQGLLGVLSSLGIFAAVFLAGGYQLLQSHREMSPLYKLVLITLIAVLGGRALEMMVGVARISDLTIFWVMLGMFAALPATAHAPEPVPQPARPSSRRQRQNLARSQSSSRSGTSNRQWLGKLAIATWLIGAILVLTWMKGISHPRAAVQAGNALEYARQGDLPSTLSAIDGAIELAPDVPVYYNWRASVYTAYRRDPRAPRVIRCDAQNEVSYEVCLAALAHESNLTGSSQRPFYYRSKIALADSALNLFLDDESIRYFRESLNMVPSSWALRDNLASALLQQGKPSEALGLLQESLDITQGEDPSINALIFRAMAYLELSRFSEAIDDLDTALELDDNDIRAHATRALAYTNIEMHGLAEEDADRAEELGADRAAIDRAIENIKQQQ
jgi:Tfp pilus assembly protein PilF/O-antigen ligase